MTTDEMTNRDYDYLMGLLCPLESLDVWHMVKHAEECNISMNKLAEILQDQADNWGVNLYDGYTDVNALLNDYILNEATADINKVLDIDIINNYNVYFYVNYSVCPLQYPTEATEAIEEAIKETNVIEEDFNIYAQYILDAMGVTFENKQEEV